MDAREFVAMVEPTFRPRLFDLIAAGDAVTIRTPTGGLLTFRAVARVEAEQRWILRHTRLVATPANVVSLTRHSSMEIC
jgi:hypothetical protein